MPYEVVQIVSIVMGTLTFTGVVWAVAWYLVKKKELEGPAGQAGLGPAVEALRDDVEQLVEMQEATRMQLAETQERLDFAERLLTAGRTPPAKPNL